MTIPWRDVFPAMTTQFRRDESLDLDATGRHIERMIASGASGIVMLGSLGENATLAPEEKRRVVAAAIEAAAGRVPVIATVVEITDAQGQVLYEAPKTKMRQAISRGTANVIRSMLRRAVDQGTGAALRSRYGVTVPLAGKTGTSQDQRDAWFFGYTPGLVVGTWVGARDPSIHFRSSLGTGGQLALPIAGAVFHGIEASKELRTRYIKPFGAPDSLTPSLECPARHDPNAVQEFFTDLFDGRKEPGKPVDDPADSSRRRGLLQRIFGKEPPPPLSAPALRWHHANRIC